jgi:lipid-A-disaccharide synthase
MAHCDVALAASGTVTVEAALLGAPMVTYYRVKQSSWLIGRWLVDVPFFSMVNLVAEKRVVPELIQGEMSAENIAREAGLLLRDPGERARMKRELAGVAERLAGDGVDAMMRAADEVQRVAEKHAEKH